MSDPPDALQLRGTNSDIIHLDYKDEDTIKLAAADLKAKNISLDVLVNCGGKLDRISLLYALFLTQPRHQRSTP